jgi:hypothetical protein
VSEREQQAFGEKSGLQVGKIVAPLHVLVNTNHVQEIELLESLNALGRDLPGGTPQGPDLP